VPFGHATAARTTGTVQTRSAMPPKRIPRKKLKQDGFLDFTSRAYAYVQEKFTMLAIAVVVIAVIVIGTSMVLRGRERGRQEASYLVYEGQSFFEQHALPAAEQSFRDALSHSGSGLFADQARLGLARTLMAQSRDTEALDVLEEGIAAQGIDEQTGRDMLAYKGAVLLNLGRYPEAEELYRQLLAHAADEHEKLDYSLRLADTLKLEGHLQEAVAVLEDFRNQLRPGEDAQLGRAIDARLDIYRALAALPPATPEQPATP
jgi:tetratricopeptide (TPR) repeat protein